MGLYAQFRLNLAQLDQVVPFLPAEGCLLDLGCGYGILANYLAMTFPRLAVIGIDSNNIRISSARRMSAGRKNIEFIAGDAQSIHLPYADTIIASDFLHHLPMRSHSAVIARLYSLLKANGILLIQEVNTRPRWKYLCSYLSDVILYPFEQRCQFQSPEEWVQILKSNGFRQVDVLPGGRASPFARVSYLAYK